MSPEPIKCGSDIIFFIPVMRSNQFKNSLLFKFNTNSRMPGENLRLLQEKKRLEDDNRRLLREKQSLLDELSRSHTEIRRLSSLLQENEENYRKSQGENEELKRLLRDKNNELREIQTRFDLQKQELENSLSLIEQLELQIKSLRDQSDKDQIKKLIREFKDIWNSAIDKKDSNLTPRQKEIRNEIYIEIIKKYPGLDFIIRDDWKPVHRGGSSNIDESMSYFIDL
jgi:chromosome segregation ATPase